MCRDGRKYLVNMLWDHRPGRNRFAGIVLQEYSVTERRLIGTRQAILEGTAIGFTEAPHLYKRHGYYYLVTAEGGTGWGHAVTMARSRTLTGPYQLHPDTYILTSRHRPDAGLQRAGHADLVDTPQGDTFIAYLCGRPIPNRGRCILGRETAMQPMMWGSDGWLRTIDGLGLPMVDAPAPALAQHPFATAADREHFDSPVLPIDFQWLRSPWPDELFSLTARPGHLRLFGRETIGSLFRQSLVARRQQAHCYSAATVVDFAPEHFQQMAGLVCYYNGAKYHYLHVSHDETHRPAHARDVGAAGQVGRRVHAARRHSRRRAGRTCASRWTTSGSTSPTGRRAPTGSGCRSSSTPASSRTKPPRRGCRTSRARSSAWPARTWRARRAGRLRLLRVPRARVFVTGASRLEVR